MANRQLRTVPEVVDTIGRERLMEITGRASQHVTNWIAAGRFPPTTYKIVTDELASRNARADQSLWQMEKRGDFQRAG